jgi:hypothetical protein
MPMSPHRRPRPQLACSAPETTPIRPANHDDADGTVMQIHPLLAAAHPLPAASRFSLNRSPLDTLDPGEKKKKQMRLGSGLGEFFFNNTIFFCYF